MISRLIRFAKGDPLKIVMATAIITLIVALDGDGFSNFHDNSHGFVANL